MVYVCIGRMFSANIFPRYFHGALVPQAFPLSTKTQQINSFRKFYALAEAVFVCVST